MSCLCEKRYQALPTFPYGKQQKTEQGPGNETAIVPHCCHCVHTFQIQASSRTISRQIAVTWRSLSSSKRLLPLAIRIRGSCSTLLMEGSRNCTACGRRKRQEGWILHSGADTTTTGCSKALSRILAPDQVIRRLSDPIKWSTNQEIKL